MAEAAKVEVKLETIPAKAEPATAAELVAAKVEAPKVADTKTVVPAAAPPAAVPAAALAVKAAPAKPAKARKKFAAKPAVLTKKTAATKPAAPKTPVKKVAPRASAPVATPIKQVKAKIMTMNESIKNQAETAMLQGKAAVEQIQTKAREAMDQGVKSMEEINTLARGNVEAVVEAGRVAAKGFESITQSAIELAKKNAEATTSAVRSFASAKNANDLLQLQSDFARSQFDKMVADGSKMTEMFVKFAGEVFEPISNRFAVAADKVAKAGIR